MKTFRFLFYPWLIRQPFTTNRLGWLTLKFQGTKHKFSKVNFRKILGLTPFEGEVNPDLMASTNIIWSYFHMGYNFDISVLLKFNKFALTPICNALFPISFKCFLERVTRIDSASNMFHTLLYILFAGDNVDLGQVLLASLFKVLTLYRRILKFLVLAISL